MSAAHIQIHFILLFIMSANTMKPDQTAHKGKSYLAPYCLQYRPQKYQQISEQSTVVMICGKSDTVNSEIFARILFSRIALKDIFAT